MIGWDDLWCGAATLNSTPSGKRRTPPNNKMMRSQRYALIVQDGTVKEVLVEPGPGLNVSSAESVLGKL